MHLNFISALLLYGAVAHAFHDTTPFLAFISSDNPVLRTGSSPQQSLVHSSELSSLLAATLEQCPTDVYVFASQPGVTAKDLSDKNTAPHLRRLMTTANETSNWRIKYPEVVGSIDLSSLQGIVTEKCGAATIDVDQANGIIRSSDAFPQVLNVQFPALSTSAQAKASELLSHDSFLNTVLNNIHPRTYTIIYTTTSLNPASKKPATHSTLLDFDADNAFHSVLHTDLKRDLHAQVRQANETPANAALFETYAFLSPGIFMGGFISLLLFLLLYVGVTAIGSLQIPVAAFSKEMGPAAQKKQ